MNPLSTASTVDIGFIPHYHHLHHPSPQLALTVAIQPHMPLPSPEGCGPSQPHSPGGSGRQEEQGGHKKWEAQAVHSEARQDESRVSLSPVFFSTTTTNTLKPPLRPLLAYGGHDGQPTTTTPAEPMGREPHDDDNHPTAGLEHQRRRR